MNNRKAVSGSMRHKNRDVESQISGVSGISGRNGTNLSRGKRERTITMIIERDREILLNCMRHLRHLRHNLTR
jgi:hypothetical protein